MAILLTAVILINCSKTEPEAPVKEFGVQVYSLRNQLGDDFDGTLKKVAETGYAYIEAYAMGTNGKIYGMEPEEYKKKVEDLGMKVVSAHSSYFTPEEAPIMIETAKKAGLDMVIVPYLSEDLRGDYDAIAENLNEVGAMFKEAGIEFGYHNHAFEFEETSDGRIPLEILIEGTDPENVSFQADLYWVVNAGHDPMELINKYPGRFNSFHVKDADVDLNQTTVGTGIIDFKTILENSDKAGIMYFFVEDERTDDPFANIKGAFDNLQKLDY